MKRILACTVFLALLAVMIIPTLADDEADTSTPESSEQTVTDVSELSETPSSDGEEQPLLSENGYAENTQSSESASSPSSSVLRFEDLRDTIEKNNSTVKMMHEQLDGMDDIDTYELDKAVRELEKLNRAVQDSLVQVSTVLAQMQMQAESSSQPPQEGAEIPEMPESPDGNMILVYGSLATALTADAASLSSQIATLKAQVESIESMESTIEQTKNTLNNAVDQIVKGAETLYIGIVTMESAVNDVQRGLDTLDRAQKIVDKQYELGMASLYDVESMRYQRKSVQSQLDSLEFQITTAKVTLESMCGLSLKGSVTLCDLSAPTYEELSAVSFAERYKSAESNNVDIKNARITYEDDDSDANEYALMAAEDAFESNFKIIVLTVKEKERLTERAKESVEFQERTLTITEKKYELGMVSYEEYMAGKSELEQAKSDLHSAELALFSAYRDYLWARDKGIA